MLKLFSFTVVLFTLLTAASRVLLAQISFERTYGGSLSESSTSVQQTTDGGYIIVGNTGSFGAGENDIYLLKTDLTGDTLWTKTFGSEFYDYGGAVKQTTDEGYIIAGSKFRKLYLIKTNSFGDTLWTKLYDFNCPIYSWFCNDIQQTTDGGYVIAGGFILIDERFPFLLKTDIYGDSLWLKMDYLGWWNYIHSVQQTADGGYILADGYSIIKTDSIGDTLWTRHYITSSCISVQQTMDGGYVVAGSKYDGISSIVALIKTSTSGDTIWTNTYDYWDGYDCYGNSVVQTSDGGYVITGGIETNQYYYAAFMIKTDSTGDTLWTKTFGEGDYGSGYSVHQTNDGGYVFVGTMNVYTDSSDIYLVKTLHDGSVLPVELTSFNATTNGKEVILNWSTATETNNQGFEIERASSKTSPRQEDWGKIGFVPGFGTTAEPNRYSYSDHLVNNRTFYYRLKQVDYDGSYEYSNVVVVEWHAFNSYLLEQCYPNPFNPTTTIGFGIQNRSNVKISILNAIGEEVEVVLNEDREPGFHQVEFNAASLPSGVYFYQLRAGSFVETKKMILMK